MNQWMTENGKSKMTSSIGFHNVLLSEVRVGSVRKDKEFKC